MKDIFRCIDSLYTGNDYAPEYKFWYMGLFIIKKNGLKMHIENAKVRSLFFRVGKPLKGVMPTPLSIKYSI